MSRATITREQMDKIRQIGKAFATVRGEKSKKGQPVAEAHKAFKLWYRQTEGGYCKITLAQFGRSLPRAKYPRYISRSNGKACTFFRTHSFQ